MKSEGAEGRPENTERRHGVVRSPGSSDPGKSDAAAEVCPRCSESTDLALVKGCLRCLNCGYKWDCNGW